MQQQFFDANPFGTHVQSDFFEPMGPLAFGGPPSRVQDVQYIVPQHMDHYGQTAPVLFGGDSTCHSCSDPNPGMVKRKDLSTQDYALYRNYLEGDHPRDVVIDSRKKRKEWSVNEETGRWRPSGTPYVLHQQQPQPQYVQYVDPPPQGRPGYGARTTAPPVVANQTAYYRTANPERSARQVMVPSGYHGNANPPIGNGRVYGMTSY